MNESTSKPPNNRLSSPDELHKLVKITSSRSWIALFSLGFLLITIIIWGIFGNIPLKVDGQGILLKSGGVRNIVHTSTGRLTDVRIQAGDYIRQGDVVARIEQYPLVQKIRNEQDRLLVLLEKQQMGTTVELEQAIDEVRYAICQLQEEYEVHSTVVSAFQGKVLEVGLSTGDILTAGAPLASVELEGSAIREEGIMFVSPFDSKILRPGMEVKIAPSFVKPEEYGFMLGRVISISEFPATFQRMLSVLGSNELVALFSSGGAPNEVRVELVTNKANVSGYEWSSPGGPPVKINSGTLFKGSIITGRQSPIEMVLPIRIQGANH